MGVYRIHNSTPLLLRVLSQHSVVSLGVVTDISKVIVVGVVVNCSKTACVAMGVGAHVDTTLWTKVTTMVTAVTAAVSTDAIVETSGGAVTGSAVSPKNGGKSMGMGGGNTGDVRTRAGGDSLV